MHRARHLVWAWIDMGVFVIGCVAQWVTRLVLIAVMFVGLVFAAVGQALISVVVATGGVDPVTVKWPTLQQARPEGGPHGF